MTYPYKDYVVEHDRIIARHAARHEGTGNIARSFALSGLVLALLLVVVGLVFWNAVLPFYGLTCWAGVT